MGCHFLSQGIFLTQGSKLHLWCLLHWQADSLPTAPPGNLCIETSSDAHVTPIALLQDGTRFKGDQRVPSPDMLTSLLGAGAQCCSVALGDRFLPLLNSLLIQLHPKAQPCQYQHGPPLTQSCPQLGLPGLTQSCFRLRTAREPRTFCAERTEAPHPQG